MTITMISPNHEFAGVVALNVRAFQDVDPDKIKVRWVDMKDEEPIYDPDIQPSS